MISSTDTIVTYVGNGANAYPVSNFIEFSDEFPENELNVVVVDSAGAESVLSYPAEWSLAVDGVVTSTSYDNTYNIFIYRSNEITQNDDYKTTGSLKSKKIEGSFDKITKIAQETRAKFDNQIALTLTETGKLNSSVTLPIPDALFGSDANSNPILLSKDEVYALLDLNEYVGELETLKDNAETAASNAATSELNASTSESNAATSESNASTSETNAGSSEANAAASAVAALASENAAESHKDDAETAKTSAEALYGDLAAINQAKIDTEVYKSEAELARDAAEAHKDNAELSEDNAAISETNASNSAISAAASASTAGSYKNDAEAAKAGAEALYGDLNAIELAKNQTESFKDQTETAVANGGFLENINLVDPSATTFGGGIALTAEPNFTAGTSTSDYYFSYFEAIGQHPCIKLAYEKVVNNGQAYSHEIIMRVEQDGNNNDSPEHYLNCIVTVASDRGDQFNYDISVINSEIELLDNNNTVTPNNIFYATSSEDSTHNYIYLHFSMDRNAQVGTNQPVIEDWDFYVYQKYASDTQFFSADVVQETRGVTFSEADGINVIYPYVRNGSTSEFFQDHIDGGNSLGLTQIYDANGDTYADEDEYEADNTPYLIKAPTQKYAANYFNWESIEELNKINPASKAGDISHAIKVSESPSYTNTIDFKIHSNGLKMYRANNSSDGIDEYDLSVAGDPSTAVYRATLDLSSYSGDVHCFCFNEDFSIVYFIAIGDDNLRGLGLTTSGEIDTATVDLGLFYVGGFAPTALGLAMGKDDEKIYITGNNSDNVHECDFGTVGDPTTLSLRSSFSVSAQDNNPRALAIDKSNNKLLMSGSQYGRTYEYKFGTTGDVDTLVFVAYLASGAMEGLDISDDGLHAYLAQNTGTIGQYLLKESLIDEDSIGSTILEGDIIVQDKEWIHDPKNLGQVVYSAVQPPFSVPYDGTAISRTAYATLFELHGTTYGVGDGSTTFNTPDYTASAPSGTTPYGLY